VTSPDRIASNKIFFLNKSDHCSLSQHKYEVSKVILYPPFFWYMEDAHDIFSWAPPVVTIY